MSKIGSMVLAFGLFSLASIGLGLWLSSTELVAVGALGLCYVLLKFTAKYLLEKEHDAKNPMADIEEDKPVAACEAIRSTDPNDTGKLVDLMLAQGRFALLLRQQIATNLDEEQFRRAFNVLAESMAFVSDGKVSLASDGETLGCENAEPCVKVIHVEPFFIDRYPVTNRQYYEFVAANGYEQISLWKKSIWPAVLDFVDKTQTPGPRYWKNGCYPKWKDDHPVVGISWFEASAYARWAGRRLPTDPEWVKAGSWPVPVDQKRFEQRKYPWGNTIDTERANLWESGCKDTVSTYSYPDGVSVGGVHQLIGNVWEWTAGDFRKNNHPEGDFVLESPMKNIRGGAFDTYFANQATCQFHSGESLMARKANVGMRLALGICDIALTQGDSGSQTLAEVWREDKTEIESEVPA